MSKLPTPSSLKNKPGNKPENKSDEETPIPINGFQQILDMLKVADPVFRESLLKRLALKDQKLANSLRRDLDV